MRRLLAAAALAALCATTAACGSDGDNSPSRGGPASAAAAATTAATSGYGNTKQICADAQKVITDSTAKFSQELTKVLGAASGGDASAKADAVKTIKAMFTELADGLRKQADKATDGQLEAALGETADQIAKVAGSIKSTDDLDQTDKLLDAPELEAANKKLESFCG
jgi:hypothetical protein